MGFEKILKRAKEEQKIVSIYYNLEDLDDCVLGFIRDINDDELFLDQLNRRGKSAGILGIRIEDIIKVHYNGIYERRLLLLHQLKEEDVLKEIRLTEYSIDNLLKYAYEHHIIARLTLDVEDEDYDIVGYISEITDEYISINALAQYGEDDGVVVVELEQIRTVSINGYFDNVSAILNSSAT